MAGDEGAGAAFDVEALDEADGGRTWLVEWEANGDEHRAGFQVVGVAELEEGNFFAGEDFEDGKAGERVLSDDASGNLFAAPVDPAFVGGLDDGGGGQEVTGVVDKEPGADAQGGAVGKDGLALGVDADDGIAAAFVERTDFAVHGFELAGGACRDDTEQTRCDNCRELRTERWPSHSWPG